MPIIILFLLALLSVCLPARGQQEAIYKIDFTQLDKKLIKVEANFNLSDSDVLSMLIHSTTALPEGEATFVQNLSVQDSKGKPLTYQAPVEGEWKLNNITDKKQRVSVHYEIRLEHDQHDWAEAGGIDEVLYTTPEGVFSTGYALFLYPSMDMQDVSVSFVLPTDWRATTAWKQEKNNTFKVPVSVRYLLNNGIFVGKHFEETLDINGFQIKFALGAKFAMQKDKFVAILSPLAKAYQEMFGGTKFKEYTIIVNEGKMTDGGAFRTSFSQTIEGEITEASKVVWGHGMAHELCHLWNGLAIAPAEQMEWFKEGATEYLAITQSAKLGILNEVNLCKKMENSYRKYLIARMMQGSQESIQEAGKEKAKNRMLVYGGGTLVCFMLDVEIREATQQQRGFPDLMRQMYEEFGKTGKPYTLADLQRLVNQTAGKDLSSFFDRFVVGKDFLDITPYLKKLGLEMNTFFEEIYISRQDMPTAQTNIFLKNVFGIH